MRSYLYLVLGAGLTIVADQLSKIWAVGALAVPDGFLPENASQIRTKLQVVSEGWFNFRLAGNKGAAWGLFRDLPESYRVGFFVVISAVAIAVIMGLYRKATGQKLLRVALTLILGGAIGNLIDRIRWGYVIDFIDWYYKESHWPTFNVADIAISTGVGLLILDLLLQNIRERKEKKAAAA